MAKSNKHTKSFEAAARRLSVLSYEMDVIKEEMMVLAAYIESHDQDIKVTLRCLKDNYGVTPIDPFN